MNYLMLPSLSAEVLDVDTDFALWAEQQIRLLRARDFHALDVEHLIGELESLVGNDRRELANRLVILLMHLLKCQFQPSRKSRSWRATIAEQRDQLEGLFEKSPSLRTLVPEVLARCYARAVKRAVRETDLPHSTFPLTNPYTPADVLDDDFMP